MPGFLLEDDAVAARQREWDDWVEQQKQSATGVLKGAQTQAQAVAQPAQDAQAQWQQFVASQPSPQQLLEQARQKLGLPSSQQAQPVAPVTQPSQLEQLTPGASALAPAQPTAQAEPAQAQPPPVAGIAALSHAEEPATATDQVAGADLGSRWKTQFDFGATYTGDYRSGTPHRGVDLVPTQGGIGTEVDAFAPGQVTNISRDSGAGGLMVYVQDQQGLTHAYMHLAGVAPNIQVGSQVSRGTPIAMMGESGTEGSPHLHYEVRKNAATGDPLDQLIDPRPYVQGGQRPQEGMPPTTQPDIMSGAAQAASWLGTEGQKALQAVLQTEGGMSGGRGDSGRSAGPLQFFEGGQLANFAQQMRVGFDEAKQYVEQHPVEAIKWAIGTAQQPGYLGRAIMDGISQGMTGADLATWAQRYGQVSEAPERAGQTWQQLFGGGQGPLGADARADAARAAVAPLRDFGGRALQGAQDVLNRPSVQPNLVTDWDQWRQQQADRAGQLNQDIQAGGDRMRQRVMQAAQEAPQTAFGAINAANVEANRQFNEPIALDMMRAGAGITGQELPPVVEQGVRSAARTVPGLALLDPGGVVSAALKGAGQTATPGGMPTGGMTATVPLPVLGDVPLADILGLAANFLIPTGAETRFGEGALRTGLTETSRLGRPFQQWGAALAAEQGLGRAGRAAMDQATATRLAISGAGRWARASIEQIADDLAKSPIGEFLRNEAGELDVGALMQTARAIKQAMVRVYAGGIGHPSDPERFDMRRANPESLFGPGAYTTEEPRVAGGIISPAGAELQPGYAQTVPQRAGMASAGVFRGHQQSIARTTREIAALDQRIEQLGADALDTQGGIALFLNPARVPTLAERRAYLAETRDIAQQRLAEMSREERGGVIRAYDVPRDLKLFDIEGRPSAADLERLVAHADARGMRQTAEVVGDAWVRARRAESDAAAGMQKYLGNDTPQGRALYEQLQREAGLSKAQINEFLEGAGYDGIIHEGGGVRPIRDPDTGEIIRHKVRVLFQSGLDKSRNAISGRLAAAVPGGAAGYESDPDASPEEKALRTAGGAFVGATLGPRGTSDVIGQAAKQLAVRSGGVRGAQATEAVAEAIARLKGSLPADLIARAQADWAKLPRVGERVAGLPPNVASPEDLAALRVHLNELVDAGAAGKDWYINSARKILDAVGGDRVEAEKLAQLVGMMAKNVNPEQNVNYAIEAWNQWKGGVPVQNVHRFSDVSQNAADLLERGIPWNGRKTNSFYINLMEEIDPKFLALKKVTADQWVNRGFGFVGKAPVGQQYDFIESELRRIADERGLRPSQVQAMLWVGQMARQAPTADGAADFSHALARRMGQVGWETAPGTGEIPGFASASPEAQQAFNHEVGQAFLDDNGHDLVAKALGALGGHSFEAPGVWLGDVTPGWQTQVAVAAGPKAAKGGQVLRPASRQAIEAVAGAKGWLLSQLPNQKQNAVGWTQVFPADAVGAANAVDINAGRVLTVREAQEIGAGLTQALANVRPRAGEEVPFILTSTERGAWVRNTSEMPNPQFHRAVQDALEGVQSDVTFRHTPVRADSGLVVNDWETQPNGEGFIDAVRRGGREEAFRAVQGSLGRRIADTQQAAAERLFGPGGPPKTVTVGGAAERAAVPGARDLSQLGPIDLYPTPPEAAAAAQRAEEQQPLATLIQNVQQRIGELEQQIRQLSGKEPEQVVSELQQQAGSPMRQAAAPARTVEQTTREFGEHRVRPEAELAEEMRQEPTLARDPAYPHEAPGADAAAYEARREAAAQARGGWSVPDNEAVLGQVTSRAQMEEAERIARAANGGREPRLSEVADALRSMGVGLSHRQPAQGMAGPMANLGGGAAGVAGSEATMSEEDKANPWVRVTRDLAGFGLGMAAPSAARGIVSQATGRTPSLGELAKIRSDLGGGARASGPAAPGGTTPAQVISAIGKQNLLAGVPGNLANIVSQLVELGLMPARAAFGGRGDQAYIGVRAAVGSVPEALNQFRTTMTTGRSLTSGPGQKTQGWLPIFRFIGATDDFFRTMGGHMGSAMKAQELVNAAGADTPTAIRQVLQANRQQIFDAGQKSAATSVFQAMGAKGAQDMGTPFGRWKEGLLAALPQGKGAGPWAAAAARQGAGLVVDALVPFAGMPARIFDIGFGRIPGIGETRFAIQLGRAIARKDLPAAQEELGNLGVQSIVSGVIVSNALAGNVTGPDDLEHPNSVRINGTWVDYSRWGAFQLPLAITGATVESVRKTGSKPDAKALDYMSAVMNTWFKVGRNAFFLDSAFDLADRIGSGSGVGALAQTATQYTDRISPAFINQVEQALDENIRQVSREFPKSVVERVASRIPGLAETLKPQVETTTGEPRRRPKQGVGGVLFGAQEDPQSRIEREIATLNRAGYTDLKPPRDYPREIGYNGARVPMTEDEQYRLAQARGKLIQQQLGEYIDSPNWNLLTDQQKAQMIDRAMSRATERNVATWAQTTDPAQVQERLRLGREVLGKPQGATP